MIFGPGTSACPGDDQKTKKKKKYTRIQDDLLTVLFPLLTCCEKPWIEFWLLAPAAILVTIDKIGIR